MMRICGSPAGSVTAGPCCSSAAASTAMSVSFLMLSPPAMLVATIGSPSAVAVGASSAVSSSVVGAGVASGAGVDALSAAAASGVGDASTGGAPSSMRTDAASSCSGSSQSRSLSASGAPPAAADAICRPNTVSPTQASFCRSVISAHLRLHSPQYIWFRGWNYVTASAILRAKKF